MKLLTKLILVITIFTILINFTEQRKKEENNAFKSSKNAFKAVQGKIGHNKLRKHDKENSPQKKKTKIPKKRLGFNNPAINMAYGEIGLNNANQFPNGLYNKSPYTGLGMNNLNGLNGINNLNGINGLNVMNQVNELNGYNNLNSINPLGTMNNINNYGMNKGRFYNNEDYDDIKKKQKKFNKKMNKKLEKQYKNYNKLGYKNKKNKKFGLNNGFYRKENNN